MLKDILNQTALNDILKVQKDLVKSMRRYRLGYTPEDMAISYLRSTAVGLTTRLSPKYDTGSSLTLANTFMVYHSDSLCKPNTYDYGLTEKQCGDLINLITCCAYKNNKFVSDIIKGIGSDLLLESYKDSLKALHITDVDLTAYEVYSLIDCKFTSLLNLSIEAISLGAQLKLKLGKSDTINNDNSNYYEQITYKGRIIGTVRHKHVLAAQGTWSLDSKSKDMCGLIDWLKVKLDNSIDDTEKKYLNSYVQEVSENINRYCDKQLVHKHMNG